MNKLDFVRSQREAAIQKCDDLRVRIAHLEARVAAADKLAEVLRNTQLYLGDHAIPNALAAYQATKEGKTYE